MHLTKQQMRKGQFPVSGISRAGGILDNEMLLSRSNLFNFRATFSLVNKRISARSENSTDWKLALTDTNEPLTQDTLKTINFGRINFGQNIFGLKRFFYGILEVLQKFQMINKLYIYSLL